MNYKINNLEELLLEKARVQAQLKIVQAELGASVVRTRQELKTLVDEKFSLSKQLGQLFQGGAQPGTGSSAVRAIGQVAGGGSWWGGLVSALLPMVVDFVRRQVQRRKERKAATPALEGTAPKPKSRKLFRRKNPPADGE